MSKHLDEVKRLADFQRRNDGLGSWPRGATSIMIGGTVYRSTMDFPALAAHLTYLERVESPARELDAHYWTGEGHGPLEIALHTALASKGKSNAE